MIKFIFVSIVVLTVLGQNTNEDPYLLGLSKIYPLFNINNMYDGPASVSNAPSTLTTNKKPTLEQMKYYTYYTAAVNSPFQVLDLSCSYCKKIKNDITKYEVICLSAVLNNKIHDTSALVSLSKFREEIVIAYRASGNIWNLVLDANIININSDENSDIKIHQGFYIATMSLYNEVVQLVGTMLLDNPGYKLVITGHSLGAAMARVTLFFLIKLNQFPETEMEIYTYGEPRSGNKQYVDFLNAQRITSARITTRGDIVPHLPPTSILGTNIISDYYVHAQTEFFINGEDGQMFCNQSVYEDLDCLKAVSTPYNWIDHMIYFDVNHGASYSDIHAFQAIPFGIYHPVGTIPPLPKPIQIVLGDIGQKMMNNSKKFIHELF